MANTLVLFAHPFLEFSDANRELIEVYKRDSNFYFKDLYEEFPDMHIPAFRERKRIADYDRYVFHFPLIWFGMPPLLRLWIDEISDGNWLIGKEPNPFENKDVHIIITSRNHESSFCHEGKYCYSVDELISGFLVTLKIFKARVQTIYPIFEVEKLSKEQLIECQNKIITSIFTENPINSHG